VGVLDKAEQLKGENETNRMKQPEPRKEKRESLIAKVRSGIIPFIPAFGTDSIYKTRRIPQAIQQDVQITESITAPVKEKISVTGLEESKKALKKLAWLCLPWIGALNGKRGAENRFFPLYVGDMVGDEFCDRKDKGLKMA